MSEIVKSSVSATRLSFHPTEFVDGCLGLVLLVAINFLWFGDNPGFIDVAPHPYWLVVIPVAARHGFRSGLFTGFLAGLTWIAMAGLGQPDFVVETFLLRLADPEFFRTPLLFLIAGLVIGEISQIGKNRYGEVRKELDELRVSYAALSERYEKLNQAKEELDTHIISREQTVSTFHEAAQSLRSLAEKDIYPASVNLLKKFLSVEACSVYVLSGNQLHLAAGLGDNGKDRPETAEPDKGMMGRAFTLGRIASIQTFDCLAPSEPIFSAPIKDSKDRVLGILNVEELPFAKFNPQTLRLAALLSEWIGSAVENARTYQKTREQIISDDITGAYTYNYFMKRLHEEFHRTLRYGYPASLMALEIADFRVFSKSDREDILIVLSSVFQNRFRLIDLLFHGADPSSYFIYMPHTAVENARMLKVKIVREIGAFGFSPYPNEDKVLGIRAGVAGISSDMAEYKDLIQNALEDMS